MFDSPKIQKTHSNSVLFLKFVSIQIYSADGIKIKNVLYNVFCYADDILLASLTVTGLQNMINLADQYISDYSLRFNLFMSV